MRVINRQGVSLEVSFDEIKKRIARLCSPDDLAQIDVDRVVIQTVNGIYDGISTRELDDLSARICASLQSVHYLYDALAARILVSNLAKGVRGTLEAAGFPPTFSGKTAFAAAHAASTLDPAYAAYVAENAEALDATMRYDLDAELSYFSLRTLEKSYLMRIGDVVIESPQDMWMRVAVTVAGALEKDGRLKSIVEVYCAMARGDYTHATPTLFNAGMKVQQCSSCYLLGTDDSLTGIFKTLADCAQISKWAGGIGLHVTNVRAKGSRIASTNGVSDGIVPMLKVYNECARYCNQSGRRKGSIAIYLEPWHADVWEFVELRRNTGAETERTRDLFLALWVPDEFMRRLEADEDWYLMSPDACLGLIDAVGDDFSTLYNEYVKEGRYMRKVKARALWQHVLNCQLETGTPYVMFKDHVNRKCNQSNVGTVRSSNLCVAPETRVLTSTGYHPISELEGKPIKVWNGKQFSDTVVYKTGVDQPLIKVGFSNGEDIECTPYHKFHVQGREGDSPVVEAKDLRAGEIIAEFDMPVVPDAELMSGFVRPYEHGQFCTGGFDGGRPLDEVAAKFDVPINHVLSEKLRWLEGLFDGGGCVLTTNAEWNGDASIQVSSSNAPFLLNVKRMLNTMGVDPKVSPGGSAEYHLLLINSFDTAKLLDMSFSPKCLPLKDMGAPLRDYSRTPILVTGIADLGRRDDTYCFTETLEHKGVFNGIIAGQCAEITEVSDDTTYAVCNLASIAVNRFVKGGDVDHARLHLAAKQLTYNLNRVIDVNTYPTPECRASNMAMRPIGVGVQGLGDLYCMLGLPYDDPRAVALDAEVIETIYHGCVEASVELAERDGAYSRFAGSPASEGKLQFDLWDVAKERLSGRWDWSDLKTRVKRSGMRNSLLTALMPTATTSQILGNCESFEPFQANVFKRSTMAGEFVVVNRHLMRDLMAAGLWNEELRRQLLAHDGSVQAIPQVPDELKRIYRTVWEVPQRSVIDHAAARGPYVDQSQSMNLYMAAPSFQKLSSALVYAWKLGLKTGVYYLRSMAAVEAIKYGGGSLAAKHPPLAVVATVEKASEASEASEDAPSAQARACPLRRVGDGGVDCLMCGS